MRRPLIEEFRIPYGLPATVKQHADDLLALKSATREGDVQQNIYVSAGGGSSGGGGGGVTDHGVLTGLADDDHPHYATDTDLTTHAGLAAHTKDIARSWTLGG